MKNSEKKETKKLRGKTNCAETDNFSKEINDNLAEVKLNKYFDDKFVILFFLFARYYMNYLRARSENET